MDALFFYANENMLAGFKNKTCKKIRRFLTKQLKIIDNILVKLGYLRKNQDFRYFVYIFLKNSAFGKHSAQVFTESFENQQ